MTTAKSVGLGGITFLPDGALSIRLEKRDQREDGEVLRTPHPFTVEPGEDLEEAFATRAADLARNGYPKIEPEALALAKLNADAFWTKGRVKAANARRAERQRAAAADEKARKKAEAERVAADAAARAQLVEDIAAALAARRDGTVG